jgi:fructokinase
MKHRIGIDLGGTKIEGVVLDETGKQVHRERIATQRQLGYETVIANIADLFSILQGKVSVCHQIGIGTPGAVSARTGLMKNSNTLLLNGMDLQSDLEEKLQVNITLENDANCFALAEAQQGRGQNHDLVFGVILGTGVGGGFVFHGNLWSGPQKIAGEWGHHSISPEDTGCYSGIPGAVETFLAGPALESAYEKAAGHALSAKDILVRYRHEEDIAKNVFEAYLDHFGRALANIINIIDPSIIVLGGGVSHIEELYSKGRQAVERYVFSDELLTPIVKNHLGDSAGVIGAAYLVPAQ